MKQVRNAARGPCCTGCLAGFFFCLPGHCGAEGFIGTQQGKGEHGQKCPHPAVSPSSLLRMQERADRWERMVPQAGLQRGRAQKGEEEEQ